MLLCDGVGAPNLVVAPGALSAGYTYRFTVVADNGALGTAVAAVDVDAPAPPYGTGCAADD